MIDLTLPAGPALNRMYKIGGKRMYKTKECKDWVMLCRAYIWEQIGPVMPLQGPVMLYLDVFPKDKRIRDLDSYFKALLDMLEDVGLLENDSQIAEIHAIRHAPTGKEHHIRVRLGKATQRQ